jgi:hypothetical protein
MKSTRFYEGLYEKAPRKARGFSLHCKGLAVLLLAALAALTTLLAALTTLLAALARVLGLLAAALAALTTLLLLVFVFFVRIVGHELAPWSVTSPLKTNAPLRASFPWNFPASCM